MIVASSSVTCAGAVSALSAVSALGAVAVALILAVSLLSPITAFKHEFRQRTVKKQTVALVAAVAAISSSAVSTSSALLAAISASSTVTHLLTVLRFSVKPEKIEMLALESTTKIQKKIMNSLTLLKTGRVLIFHLKNFLEYSKTFLKKIEQSSNEKI